MAITRRVAPKTPALARVRGSGLTLHEVTERVTKLIRDGDPGWAARYPSHSSRYQRVWRLLHHHEKSGPPSRAEAAAIAAALGSAPWLVWPPEVWAPPGYEPPPPPGRWSWSRVR